MFKLFYKTLIHIFLWIILLANLFIFFNIVGPLNMFGAEIKPNTYFGVSSLIEMFQFLPNTSLGRLADTLQWVYQYLFNLSAKILNDTWIKSFELLSVGIDSDNFWEAIVNLLTGVLLILSSGFVAVGSFFVGFAGVIVLIIYLITMVVNIVGFLLYAFGAMFAKNVPSYPSMDISPYVMKSVNSVLTSLRACC